MTEQPDLFTAVALRDQALHRVDLNADDEWKATALACVLGIAATGRPFCSDEVWDALSGFEVETHEPRALGAVMRQLATRGVIRKTGTYRKSTRPACHARDVAEWIAA